MIMKNYIRRDDPHFRTSCLLTLISAFIVEAAKLSVILTTPPADVGMKFHRQFDGIEVEAHLRAGAFRIIRSTSAKYPRDHPELGKLSLNVTAELVCRNRINDALARFGDLLDNNPRLADPRIDSHCPDGWGWLDAVGFSK